MTKLRFHQKEQRVLRFLKGSLHAKVLERLKTRGFTPATHEQGQSLLAEAVRARSAVAPRNAPSESLVPRLQELERTWVPVAQASLEDRFPKVYEELFRGYQRVTGIDVLLMLRVFVDRLRALGDETDEESRAAAQLLAERGLTPEVAAEIDALLAQAMKPAAPAPAPEPDPDEALEAERAMWRFYLEWSRIARTLVRERQLRRTLGFRDGKQASDPEVPDPAPVTGAVQTAEPSGPEPPGP